MKTVLPNADFVIEGYVDPREPLRDEGPFGDHTGYYTLPEPYPVFHVTAITHRKDAVYPATIVGIPPMEDFYIGGASVQLFLPIFKMNFPEIVDLALPAEGVFHNLVWSGVARATRVLVSATRRNPPCVQMCPARRPTRQAGRPRSPAKSCTASGAATPRDPSCAYANSDKRLLIGGVHPDFGASLFNTRAPECAHCGA